MKMMRMTGDVVECFVCADDIFLPSDEAGRNESDDFDHEIEEFKRSVILCWTH